MIKKMVRPFCTLMNIFFPVSARFAAVKLHITYFEKNGRHRTVT